MAAGHPWVLERTQTIGRPLNTVFPFFADAHDADAHDLCHQ
jgi:hypothetical protein